MVQEVSVWDVLVMSDALVLILKCLLDQGVFEDTHDIFFSCHFHPLLNEFAGVYFIQNF